MLFDNSIKKFYNNLYYKIYRDVAQFGSAPALGVGGRRFESCHLDFILKLYINKKGF